MGFHHLSNGRNNHQPYRWIVDTAEDRASISENQDGMPFKDSDGLYCRCLQLDDLSEWLLSSIDPVEWVSAGGGGKEKQIYFSLQTPAQSTFLPMDEEGFFTKKVSNKRTPYITQNFDNYKTFLFEITEYNNQGGVINKTSGLQFDLYVDLMDWLNTNLEASGDVNVNAFEVSCYSYSMPETALPDRVKGENTFYSVLRGKSHYKSTRYKTIQPSDGWAFKQDFINMVYQDFLSTTPPSLENACKTMWVTQTARRMYLHTSGAIKFESGIQGNRMYYNEPNGVPYNVSGGTWNIGESKLYMFQRFNLQVASEQDGTAHLSDFNMNYADSIVRVYHLTNGTPGRHAFLIKPIGMDFFRIGWTEFAHKPEVDLFFELKGRDAGTKIFKVDSTPVDMTIAFSNQVSRTFTKTDISQKMSGSLRYHTSGTDYIYKKARYFLADDQGNRTPPSKWLEFQYKKTQDSPVLLIGQF